MPGNPVGSKWRSTPRARRHAVQPPWTIDRAMIAHIAAEAQREGITASALARRALRAQFGEPPRLPPEETVKENRQATQK